MLVKRIAALCLLLAGVAGKPAASQTGLVAAAESAARAWLAHDAAGLVGRSQALVLQIPGADPSAALGRAQAIELLRRHFQSATERNVVVATTREVDPGRGVVELDRHYVVRGTSDQRRESVFLGFRQVQGEWILGEVRTAQ